MIVQDKVATMHKAHEVSAKIISMITNETKDFTCEDDPAEQIYLACHILGSLTAKILISLEGYGKIYAIPNLTIASIKEWTDLIAREHLKNNEHLGSMVK